MVLLVMIVLAMLTLTTVEFRMANHSRHQREAQANARLALMIAMGELQKLVGPDQRVTARAAILEDPSGGGIMPNRNWLGVWKTTYEFEGQEWPLIGKAPDNHGGPYPYVGVYSDLRETEPSLNESKWKNSLLQGWLVSRKTLTTVPSLPLDDQDEGVIELLGRGTLGNVYNDIGFGKNRVLVEKITVPGGGVDGNNGAYAWYASDNNQKASLALDPDLVVDDQIPFLATQTDNPTSVESTSGTRPYANYSVNVRGRYGKLITDRSVGLVEGFSAQREITQEALGSHFHHFTTHGSGLFVDVTLGGFKKDLTPLLFGMPDLEMISYASPSRSVAAHDFSSDDPIIPGPRHAVLGPSFGALRYWGRMKSLDGLGDGEIEAQVAHQNSTSTRVRPGEDWPLGVSDGLTFDGGQWASKAPKIHPIMTDVSWHYYFSHTEGTLNSLRTHIQPRVCLWNPYQVTMKTEPLIVLMPNPYRAETAFHFTVESGESEREEGGYSLALGENWPLGNGEAKIAPVTGGLFPDHRYLAFLIEGSLFEPGECLVFSPLVTSPDFSAGEINIKKYDATNIAANLLSAKSPQGYDHFFIDYQGKMKLRTRNEDSGALVWTVLHEHFFEYLDFSKIIKYQSWPIFTDNLPFVLKAVTTSPATSAEDLAASSQSGFPTLQLINNGNGGVATYDFRTQGLGDSTMYHSPFRTHLATFDEWPDRQGSSVHQWGAKLLWLDESQNEGVMDGAGSGGGAPLRGGMWSASHSAYHLAPLAHWNVRPGVVTRSPASPCTSSWSHKSCGAWMLQLNPFSRGDLGNAPSMNHAGYYSKSPFARAHQLADPRAVLFDLPDPVYGSLSMGSLRHAQLSPYSWHPSYIVGHSLADLHAPFDRSAFDLMAGSYTGSKKSSWDEAVGGYKIPWSAGKHGPRLAKAADNTFANSTGLLQIGTDATTKDVDGQSLSSQDEVLAYDISYEVNQNLWDAYFLSGVPMNANGTGYVWSPDHADRLWNARYRWNSSVKMDFSEVVNQLTGSNALEFSFWNNAYWLKNSGAFNVNSTSVEAWISFLSGLQGVGRVTESGRKGGGAESVFSRVQQPLGAVKSDQTGVEKAGGWLGGRVLDEAEIKALAQQVVNEVKRRGPFVSMADFVNRRLAPKNNPTSMRGALEQAIAHTDLNKTYQQSPFLTSSDVSHDNNHPDWVMDVDKQPVSKAWGIPGYITQSDLLEPLAPAMTVRGDSFTLRCYGESRDQGNKIRARAYLEAIVIRSPEYVKSMPMNSTAIDRQSNQAMDPALFVQRSTGEIHKGSLSRVNQKFGRQFQVKSLRWLSGEEV